MADFPRQMLGGTNIEVSRLGLSASYRPGEQTVFHAVDLDLNLFFGFGIDYQMTSAFRKLPANVRQRCVVVTGAYNLILGHPNLRRSLERRLRQWGRDYIDVFLFLGVMKEREFPASVQEELCRFREEGKVRAIGVSTHDRKLAGRLAADRAVDVLMIRYNAAHRGAESEIFPYVFGRGTGILAYTATRWTKLLRPLRSLPAPPLSPGDCYRFVLSHPAVDACLTAPSQLKELDENIAAARLGPLDEGALTRVREFGDAVHARKDWFM